MKKRQNVLLALYSLLYRKSNGKTSVFLLHFASSASNESPAPIMFHPSKNSARLVANSLLFAHVFHKKLPLIELLIKNNRDHFMKTR
jgi:hypothetical protein